MKKTPIDQQVQDSLTDDEQIEQSFNLQGRQVYATNKRLLVIEGRTIRDFDYNHISSIAYSSKRYRYLIAIGIILILTGVSFGYFFSDFFSDFFGDFFGELLMVPFIIVGVICIITGFLRKSEWVEANVVGLSTPQIFSGEKDKLESLLQIIRQRQTSEHEEEPKKAKDIDFAEALRKLAELRDDGIITQEEFEEKKKRILSSD